MAFILTPTQKRSVQNPRPGWSINLLLRFPPPLPAVEGSHQPDRILLHRARRLRKRHHADDGLHSAERRHSKSGYSGGDVRVLGVPTVGFGNRDEHNGGHSAKPGEGGAGE